MRAIMTLSLFLALAGCGSGCGGRSANSHGNATSVTGPTHRPGESRRAHVGTNLAEMSYGSGMFPFVDLMKHTDARWIAGAGETWDDGRRIATDARGWITSLETDQVARLFLLAGDQFHPTGTFTVLFEGRGQIDYRGRVSNVRREPGRHTFDLAAPDGLYLDITSVDASDPIRNIRVIAPGGRCQGDERRYCETDDDCDAECVAFTESYAESPFHPSFLTDVAPFGVLRFMDWAITNREVVLDDDDELPPIRTPEDLAIGTDHRTWRPAPVDVMVQLANTLDADPWFNMPTAANDATVRAFARRVAETLDADRTVYVEYSNEVWNSMFDQHRYAAGRGCRSYGGTDETCDPDGNGIACERTEWNDQQAACLEFGHRFFVERTVQIGQIWKQAFGDASSRVQVVYGTQIGGSDWWIPMLTREVSGAPAHTRIDIVAVAPYFGSEDDRTLEQIFARETREGWPHIEHRILLGAPDAEWGSVKDWIRKDIEALRREIPEGLRYVTYEGGQHLTSPHEANVWPVLIEANRDPRMEALYDDYLSMWSRLSGGELFVHFTSPGAYTRYGSWGSKEWQGQPLEDAPKHRALLRYAAGE